MIRTHTNTAANSIDNLENTNAPRFIAFYLPQFYPTPYNDEWWGKGFTEWTGVTRARPRFLGHYQPHLPADLGFCDLRLPEVREAQANLAREYGVYGFCYYHYWFTGQRILERPLDEVLSLGRPDFPFCICWANQNWSREWARDATILLKQDYSEEDDATHIRHLLAKFEDRRYIRVEGKILVLLYRVELLPNPERTADIWRNEVRRAGLGDLFLVAIENNYVRFPQDYTRRGFDAAMRFQPNRNMVNPSRIVRAMRHGLRSPIKHNWIYSYDSMYRYWRAQKEAPYRTFECVTPMWDNSPRRERAAFILEGSTPEKYELWIRDAVNRSKADQDGNRWVFINAWNEWGEGCHLEPCQKWGRKYLEATKRVRDGLQFADHG